MARQTSRLNLDVWDLESDYYVHVDLYNNWDKLDDVVLQRTGDESSGPIVSVLPAVTDTGFGTRISTDSDPRIKMTGQGITWGPGNDDPDASIFRTGTTTLSVTGRMRFSHATLAPIHGDQEGANDFIENTAPGDDEPLFVILGDGSLSWGDGTNVVADTFAYRKSAGVLKVINTLEADNLDATEVSIGGNTIKFVGGALSLDVPFVTSGYAAARNGHAGRIRLGDPGDPNNAIISFGSGPNASIFMTSTPSLRLKTNNLFEAASLLSSNLTSNNATIGALTSTSITANGPVDLRNNVSVLGTLTGQGGSFSSVDVRGGVIGASGAGAITLNKNVNIPSSFALGAHTLNISGYINSNWDLNAKHVYINSGFIQVRNTSYLQVDGAAGFNGSFSAGDAFFGGSVYAMNIRSQDGYIRAHNQFQALGGLHMGGQMLIGASVVATDNIRHSSNDPHAYVGFGPIRLVSSDPGARQVDLNHGSLVRGGINTMGYNINLSGGQLVGQSDETLKHKFRPLSDDKFFNAAKTLDVKSWSWKKGDEERHIGPTVQEFEDKFGYGVVGDGLSMMDMIGVLYKLSSIYAKKISAIEVKLSQETI